MLTSEGYCKDYIMPTDAQAEVSYCFSSFIQLPAIGSITVSLGDVSSLNSKLQVGAVLQYSFPIEPDSSTQTLWNLKFALGLYRGEFP